MIRVTLRIGHIDSSPLFRPGVGTVNSWSQVIARDVRGEARDLAPHPGGGRSMARHEPWATGNLWASLYSDVNPTPALRHLDVEVGARSDHAVYVHEGTANNGMGYITSRSGQPMPIKRNGFVVATAHRVRGQQANPFLVDAYHRVAAVHRLPRMV